MTTKKALPKITQPIYEMVLPSNGQTVRFRPFTVKEEKLLMMASETKEQADIFNIYKQIINNCLLDDVDVNQLAVVDVELFFIRLRARSVSNIAQFIITDAEDKKDYTLSVDLDEVQAIADESHTKIIELTDQVSCKMRYPTFEDALEYSTVAKLDTRKAVKLMFRACIDSIFTEEDVYDPRDYDDEQFDEFFDAFRRPQLEAIEHFINTMPTVKHVVTYKRADGEERTLELVGIDSFF